LLSDGDGAIAGRFGVKRGLLGKFMPVKRTTFVIDTDRTLLAVISSEVSMDAQADKALEVLRSRWRPPFRNGFRFSFLVAANLVDALEIPASSSVLSAAEGPPTSRRSHPS
jgi:hypothetical protein